MRYGCGSTVDGPWSARHCEIGVGSANAGADSSVATFSVPMDMRTLAFRSGLCPDPRLGAESVESDWVALREWWLSAELAAGRKVEGKERCFLVCEGLDHLAHLYVNGELVAASRGFNQSSCDDIIEPDGGPGVRRRFLPDPLKSALFHGGDHNPYVMNCGIASAPRVVVADRAFVTSMGVRYDPGCDAGRLSGEIVELGVCWEDTEARCSLEPDNFCGEPLIFGSRWTGKNPRDANTVRRRERNPLVSLRSWTSELLQADTDDWREPVRGAHGLQAL